MANQQAPGMGHHNIIMFYVMKPEQKWPPKADGIFTFILLKENVWILIIFFIEINWLLSHIVISADNGLAMHKHKAIAWNGDGVLMHLYAIETGKG